jgi:hypothetical protein
LLAALKFWVFRSLVKQPTSIEKWAVMPLRQMLKPSCAVDFNFDTILKNKTFFQISFMNEFIEIFIIKFGFIMTFKN